MLMCLVSWPSLRRCVPRMRWRTTNKSTCGYSPLPDMCRYRENLALCTKAYFLLLCAGRNEPWYEAEHNAISFPPLFLPSPLFFLPFLLLRIPLPLHSPSSFLCHTNTHTHTHTHCSPLGFRRRLECLFATPNREATKGSTHCSLLRLTL